eukprot:scaffold2735_cov107-Skeletonema_marinoi.AAC.3
MVFTLDGIDDGAAEAKEERRLFMPKLAYLSVNVKKALVGFTVLGIVGIIMGVSISGAAEYKQQQNALAAINGGGGAHSSKSGKSGSFCDTEPSIVCGQNVTEKVVLTDDLLCTDRVDGPHCSSAYTSKSAAAVNCKKGPGPSDVDPSDKCTTMKETCDLYYQVGIWLVDGASAINCKVEQFYDGFIVQNSGEVKKSEASGNRRGVVWLSGSTTKISDV